MLSLAVHSHKRPSWCEVRNSARGHWPYILSNIGIPEHYLRNCHGPCPVCGGRDRFRWDDKNGSGSFYCNNCGPGDGFKLVQRFRGCAPGEALKAVANHLGLGANYEFEHARNVHPDPCRNIETSSTEQDQKSRELSLERLWRESRVVRQGDPVYKYLTVTRRLCLDSVPSSLRFHPELPYFEGNKKRGTFPVMLAAVYDSTHRLVSIHRTYLTPDGRKAPVGAPKKLMQAIFDGATNGAAIKLFEPGEILGIAEGIETALSCHIETGVPVWSTVSAPGMVSVKVPNAVNEVWIFADSDSNSAGLRAASTLAGRLLDESRRVKLLLPDQVGVDFCDIFTAEDSDHDKT